MKSYKLVLLLRSDIKKDDKDKLFGEVKSWLPDMANDKVESIGEKKLAYQIKHEKAGEYVVYNFESDKVTGDLNRRLLLKNEILRHLVIRN